MPEAQDPFDEIMRRADEIAELAQRPDHTTGMCALCNKPVTPEEQDNPDAIYREVSSWVTGPKLQSPVLRSQTGRIAHKVCVDHLLDGQAPDQASIPGLEVD